MFRADSMGRGIARARKLRVPRSWSSIEPRDVWFVIIGIGVVIGAMWIRHGGLARDWITAAGEITALAGTYTALVGILFASRAPWLDQVFGTDGLARAHKWLGFITVWAIVAHAILSTISYGGGAISASIDAFFELIQTVPGMLGAVVGTALLIVVAITSMRAARRRMSYETFHGVHLYVYLAMALAFLHQVVIGADFLGDQLATWFWIALYVAAFAPLILHRVAWPVWLTIRHQPRVGKIVREGKGVISLHVTGRNLERLPVRSGQFFIIRALTRGEWMHGHPFSISAAPDGRRLRFTFKQFGEGTRALASLKPGTRLMLEGPYGAMHDAHDRDERRGLLMIAGGIGIAPIRAMAESFAVVPTRTDLIFRAQSMADAPLLDELQWLATRRGIRLHLLFGTRGREVAPEPFAPSEIHRLVPDAALRDIYVCGPPSLMERVRASMRELGAADKQVHYELFG